jgi:uncharacterized damage-inducible protein DinB
MPRSPLADAVAHHAWATLVLIDACRGLTNEQLKTTAPGTYGSIIDTLRHLVATDAAYLWLMTDGRVPDIEDEEMQLDEMRLAMEGHAVAWSELVATDPDPERIVKRRRNDGSETDAPLGIRLAQAIHHGTDHRSQICTALTILGIDPPVIDVWQFGHTDGRVVDIPAPR